MSHPLHCPRSSSGEGLPLSQYLQCWSNCIVSGPQTLEDLYCCMTTTVSGLPPSKECGTSPVQACPCSQCPHCLRTATNAVRPLLQNLHWPRTSTMAVSSLLSQDLQYWRNSHVAVPLLLRTFSVALPPLLHLLHHCWTSTVPTSSPLYQDLQCCRTNTSTVSGLPLL